MFKEATIQGKISGSVMIVSVTQKQTRTSKPYLILKLRDDQKKEVDAKLWNMSVEEFPFDKNTVIIGEFSVGEYNGQKDFTLDMYREALESEYRMEDFINAAPYSPQKMYEYILQYLMMLILLSFIIFMKSTKNRSLSGLLPKQYIITFDLDFCIIHSVWFRVELHLERCMGKP